MGDGHLVRPSVKRLPLWGDEWVEVRERLNHGEQTRLYRALYDAAPDGELKRRPFAWGAAIVDAYLLDWSFADLPIRGASDGERRAALDNGDECDWLEVKDAIEAHVNAIAIARLEKKRARHGGTIPEPRSPSPLVAVGAMSG